MKPSGMQDITLKSAGSIGDTRCNVILSHLCDLFALDRSAIELIGTSQNQVYAVRQHNQPAILRVSYGRHRTLAEIQSELGWIRELAAAGLPVCLPRKSVQARWCEQIHVEGTDYFAVLFDQAPGRRIEASDLNATLYRQLGQLTARLHRAACEAPVSPSERFPRSHWYESRLLTHDLEQFTVSSDQNFRESMQSLISELRENTHTATRLIHSDISFSNTFINDSELWLFDFDNCEIGSPLQDLATILYDSIYCKWVKRVPAAELPARIRECWLAFLSGYRDIRQLEALNDELLHQFCVLREGVIYIHYQRTLHRDSLTPSFREGLHEMRRNVERRTTPFSWQSLDATRSEM